ncbi:MAG: IS66 family insertion sequence element accessory protein TnpB [Mesorhizobium sp.]|nr:MAG: IS66 family insertion sequence element accessory protein TnpB [Mesorhizobium sp.]
MSRSAPMSDDRSFHILEAVPNRLEASPQRARRRWSAQAKARLIEATLKPGANVSAIAREAGMATSQLFGWRRKAIKSGAVTPQRDAGRLGFVEVSQAASSTVEICLGDVVIRAGADVGQDDLARIARSARHDPGQRAGVCRQPSGRF